MHPTKILVVDCEGESREFMREALSRLGHSVQVAGSGEEGIERFKEDVFDLVLTEVALPRIDGIEMVQHIRSSDPTVIPIIISSREDNGTIMRALEAGARSYLVKPFSDEDLRLRIEKALRERKRMVDTRLLLGDLIHTRSDLRQKIVEREDYLRHLIDAAPFGVASTDRDGRILTFNGVAERMYGYSSQEVVNQHVSRLFGQENAGTPKGKLERRPPESKETHIRKSGRPFPVLVRRREIKNEGKRCIAHLYVLEDLTDREQMEKQLLYAERLSLLGQLAPRIAHEFKTPLQAISGSTELAMEFLEAGDVEQPKSWLEHIQPAIEQMMNLIHQLSNLGKPVESKLVQVDLHAELVRVLDSLKPLGIIKYCRIVENFEALLPQVAGDPVQIEQVFRNLIVNAAQAMESERTQELTLSLKRSADGRWVDAIVEDTGPGIPDENLERVFQPFFSTKPEGKGTGLGLAIVKTILDRHGATVRVKTKTGEGTRFTVSFPTNGQEG